MLKQRSVFESALRSYHRDKMRELGCDRSTISHSVDFARPKSYRTPCGKTEADYSARVGRERHIVSEHVRTINCASCGEEVPYRMTREAQGRLVCNRC
jgi:formylmethanofuran dehydrogenase subunit E